MKRTLAATSVGLLFGSLFDLRVKDEVVHFLDPVGVRTIHNLGSSLIQNMNMPALTMSSDDTSLNALNRSVDIPLPVAVAAQSNASIANETAQALAGIVQHSSVADVLPDTIKNSTVNTGDVYLPPLPLPSNSLQVRLPFGEHRLLSVGDIGYIFAVLWGLHLIGLLLLYDVPKRSALEDRSKHEHKVLLEEADDDEEDTFDESGDNVFTKDNIANDAGSSHGDESLDGTFEKLQTMSRRSVNYGSKHSYAESLNNIWRLVLSNVAFPTTVALLFLAKATIEVLLCSGGTILNRYYAWSGALAGLFMGVVASTLLPINLWLSEEKNLVERKIIKVRLYLDIYSYVASIFSCSSSTDA
jgi:hypothetical protein